MASRALPTTEIEKLSDDELMARLEAGHIEDSLAEIQNRYREAVFRYVLGVLHDGHMAQDVTQEVFERVFLKSHLYAPQSNFRAWLFGVARNETLTALRNRKKTPTPFSSFGGEAEEDRQPFEDHLGRSDEPVLEEAEMMSAFQAAVADLPERYRTAFELCVVQGMQYQEAARRLQVPTGTVSIRIMRARRRLFDALSAHIGRLRRPPACLQ